MARVIFFLLLAIFLTGCASRLPSDEIRSSYSSGQIGALRDEMEDDHEQEGEFVTALNLARLFQMEGKWEESIRFYDEALAILEEYESRAIINVRSVASTVGTFLLARGADEYYGTGYERSLLHTFNSLNYLMQGDFSGAAVEMRKMDQRQEYWLQESQSRIEKNVSRLQNNESLPAQYSMRDFLQDDAVRNLMNNYQDPFSFALSSILFRIAGDHQAAEVNLRRAIALDKNVDKLFRQAWSSSSVTKKSRANKKGNIVIPALHPVKKSNDGENGKSADNRVSHQEVTIIALGGLTPALKVEHIRIRFPAIGYILVDMPSYMPALPSPKPYASVSESSPIFFYPLLRTDRLAYRTLKDEVAFEIGSAFSRAAVKAGISSAVYVSARSNDDTRDYAPLAGALATVLLDLWTYSMSESARNWEMLPNEAFLAMTMVKNGSTLTFGEGGNKKSLVLPNDARGAIIILTYLSNSHMRMDYVTY